MKQVSHNENRHIYSLEMEEMINYVIKATAKTGYDSSVH
jgi:hypothetical protein